MEIVNREAKIVEAIQLELEIDAQLIIRGFQELQNLNMEHGAYFLASQSISQGFERMMKVVLFLSNSIEPGQMKEFYCHDLEKLWQRVKKVQDVGTVKDKVLNKELRILSKFNEEARYHYINILDGRESGFDPQEEWERLEQDYIDSNSENYKKLANGDDANLLIQRINHRHIKSLEKIVSILSSILLRTNVKEIGWVVPLAFQKFATYSSNDFGKTDYSEWPKCLEHKDKPYKLTWRNNLVNWWERLLGCHHEKSIVVKKKNFKGIWPFRGIQKVIVIRRKKKKVAYYFIAINGYLCALNGETADKLHLPNPYKAGYAVSGISIQPFLEIAKSL